MGDIIPHFLWINICMTYLNPYLNNLSNRYEAYNGPKGNLASWEHASKLFLHDNYRLAPKVPFLYHVNFVLNPFAKALVPSFEYRGMSAAEIGLLVKTINLPKYSPRVETINRYNQKKNVETQIQYDPVTVEMHDDNDGLAYSLLQAYYKYYFVDGNYQIRPQAYTPDLTYSNFLFRYGLDNQLPHKHFFKEIHVSQLTRGVYHRYTLVNPLLSKLDHDNLDYADGGRGTQNTFTINYEAVFYETGRIDTEEDTPDGFSNIHYDETPSSLASIPQRDYQAVPVRNKLSIVEETTTITDIIRRKQLQTQDIRNNQGYTFENFRKNRFNTFTTSTPKTGQLVFPKKDGQKYNILEFAKREINKINLNELQNNPSALEAARRDLYRKNYQAEGNPGGAEEADNQYDILRPQPGFLESLDEILGV